MPKFAKKITTAANGRRLFAMPSKTDSFAFSDRLVHCFFQCSKKKTSLSDDSPRHFFPPKKACLIIQWREAERISPLWCSEIQTLGGKSRRFFKVNKKTSPESNFSPYFSFSLFPLYPSKNAKILF
jgi:hypothetical protein